MEQNRTKNSAEQDATLRASYRLTRTGADDPAFQQLVAELDKD